MLAEPLGVADRWVSDVYPELRDLAARLLRRERPGHTLQRTALVHEALIALRSRVRAGDLSRQDYLAIAAHQMREILIDYARRRKALKRGGHFKRVELDEELSIGRDENSFLALNDALDRLGKVDRRSLSVVELKFFQGCTNPETAMALGISVATVESDWQFARSWLFGALKEGNGR